MFKITMGKGFQITFENGVTASVQFGPGNYCENYNGEWDAPLKAVRGEPITSKDAEVSAWIGSGRIERWITKELVDCDDDVKGRMGVNEVIDFLIACRDY